MFKGALIPCFSENIIPRYGTVKIRQREIEVIANTHDILTRARIISGDICVNVANAFTNKAPLKIHLGKKGADGNTVIG
jgi:hypothetical protein